MRSCFRSEKRVRLRLSKVETTLTKLACDGVYRTALRDSSVIRNDERNEAENGKSRNWVVEFYKGRISRLNVFRLALAADCYVNERAGKSGR